MIEAPKLPGLYLDVQAVQCLFYLRTFAYSQLQVYSLRIVSCPRAKQRPAFAIYLWQHLL